MIRSDGDEDRRGEQQPPGREGVARKGQPCEEQRGDNEEKPQVSQRAVRLVQAGDGGFAGLLALLVFVGWRLRVGRRHVAIRAFLLVL